MMTIFNIIRLSIFTAVMAWTLIVLGLAAHLDSILIANDLTRYIPLAIFVCACTFIIIPGLLVFGFIKRKFLVQQVRMELIFVGLLGLLWFIMGLYTALQPDTEVECDFDGDGDFEESEAFSSDMYDAQFHTVEAFSLFNAILLLAYFLLLLLLSWRQHAMESPRVWRSKVTTYPWFGQPTDDDDDDSVDFEKAPAKGKSAKNVTIGKIPDEVTNKILSNSSTTPMKAGGHYIIYIPPPPPARS